MRIATNPGRTAGLFYLLGSIPAFFGLLYVPSKLMVHGDSAATASRIMASETLFRLSIVADLMSQAMFILVALALYHLLRGVNRRHARMMVILLLVSIPIAFMNEVNALAAIVLLRGSAFLSAFSEPERNALAMLFLNLRGHGFDIAGIFWGLWLFPLGLLVYRSGFIPRILGVLLMIGCFAYLANSLTALVLPRYEAVVSRWVTPLQMVEMVFMAWLIVVGARPPLEDDNGMGGR